MKSDRGLGKFATMRLQDLRKDPANAHNPKLRVCVTTIVYDSRTGGFNPLIIDSHDEKQNYTVLGAGRSTSAAPTYFKGYDGKNFDGGVYANDPKYWALSLAILKTKIENIRIVSLGTGFKESNREDDNFVAAFFEPEKDAGFLQKLWATTKSTLLGFFDSKAKLLDDPGTEKEGLRDWMNAELLSHLAFDIQKQGDLYFKMAEPNIKGRYWRLNPRLTETISLDKASAEDREKMTLTVDSYLNE